ncbi:MAG: DNA polymerase III subunit gamma/tau [Clostridia bacterium]|nr:DNA polymerase III subunit gamma/tau [Clostridia bacterium]
MYQSLYRKYRPKTFDEVCGHDHITSVLKNQVREKKTSHAYLFCGSRGTGKTSCAKILAKAVNCLDPVDGDPCCKCEACLGIDNASIMDVVEMDAASNNSVDNIRALCDEVRFMPSEVKKRVYIIDEVHMLSVSAFNALLKTLEEPPEHVLFILATTDVNKVPATIISRCQRFDFRRIPTDVIVDRLMFVAGSEGMDLDRGAAQIIARISDGGMRDALSLLEACTMVKGEITPEVITRILGLSDRELLIDLAEACAKKNPARAVTLVGELYSKSGDFKEVIADMLKLYRDLFVIKFVPTPKSFLDEYREDSERLEEISAAMTKDALCYQTGVLENLYSEYDRISSGKKAAVEIAFMKMCVASLSDSVASLAARVSELERGAPFRSTVTAQISSDAPAAADEIPERPSVPASDEPEKTPSPEAPAADSKPEYLDRLLMSMQEESLIKPYLSQVEFSSRGSALYLLTTPFIKGILEAVGAADIVLKRAVVLDGNVKSVVIAEKSAANKTPVSDGLEGL